MVHDVCVPFGTASFHIYIISCCKKLIAEVSQGIKEISKPTVRVYFISF